MILMLKYNLMVSVSIVRQLITFASIYTVKAVSFFLKYSGFSTVGLQEQRSSITYVMTSLHVK